MRAADTPLAHGYTLGQVEHLAKAAVRMAGHYVSDYLDRLDTAHGAILIHLYEAPHWPTRHALIQAGATAVHQMVNSLMHLRGYRDLDPYNGAGSAPRFATYWLSQPRIAPSPEGRIVDQLALRQILPHLTPRELEGITALAVTGDYQAAAHLLNMGYDQLCNLVNRARRRALTLWHDGETPSRVWRQDVRLGSRTAKRPTACPKGHPYDAANTAVRRSGAIRCRRCQRERMAAHRAGVSTPKTLKPCGTYAAYQRHRYHGETVDPACESAAEEYKASRRKGGTRAAGAVR